MNRFDRKELSVKRLCNAVGRRLKNVPDWVFWNAEMRTGNTNYERIMSVKDIYRGKRCIVIGNGPSLKKMDLSVLKDEYSIGTNRIYLLFDEIKLLPSYYVSVNDLVLEQYHQEIARLPMTKLLSWTYRNLFPYDDKTIFVKLGFGLRDRFSYNFTRPISSGGTVTFVALQFAYWLGFSKVIMIGIDHNFKTTGVPNESETRAQEVDQDHFHPNYFPKGSKWQLPDLKRSELAYGLALQAFKRDGRSIVDSTVGGKCTVFPKTSLEEALSE
jgi:hypothetical protein